MDERTPAGGPKTRRSLLADEIGVSNVGLVAQAYREGYRDALAEARRALRPGGRSMLHVDDALAAWLRDRPTIVGRAAILRRADLPDPHEKENPA